MSSYTPGPWTVSLAKFPVINGERCFPAGITHKINSSEQYGRVAEVLSHKQYSNKDAPRMEECEANARLIAAAPDLLEALESIHLRCMFEHVIDWRKERRKIGQICIDAIAKAMSET